jgi:hypothetical protein
VPNGQHLRTPDQISAEVSGAAGGARGAEAQAGGRNVLSATQKPAAQATPNGYECQRLQNAVKNDITRCCLVINPHKACHEMETAQAGSFAKENTTTINGRTVPNYTHFKNGIPPAAYMNYLAGLAKNATELAAALSTFVTYETIQDDNLLPAEEILSRGSGDCDNISNLFVKLLGILGTKNGHNYKAKIIGMAGANHAVAVFLDTDGKWRAFDINLPFNEMRQTNGRVDLFSASNSFERFHSIGDRSFFERKKLGPAAGQGARVDNFLNPETLMPSGKEISAMVDLDYSPRVNPDTFLIGYDWRKAELTHIHYRKGFSAYYKNGVFYQLTEQTKITVYENAMVSQIQYINHPSIEMENFTSTGLLESRVLKNGTAEIYNNGLLIQRQYKTGAFSCDFYYSTGAVYQRNFFDGKIEWYDGNGYVIKKQDKRGNITVIKK